MQRHAMHTVWGVQLPVITHKLAMGLGLDPDML